MRFSESEWTIMRILWSGGEQSLGSVTDAARGQGRNWAPSTVQTFLVRLRKKGAVDTRAEGGKLRYRAVQSREEAERCEAGRLYGSVFGGSARAMVSSLLQSEKLSAEELRQLRELIDEYAADARG